MAVFYGEYDKVATVSNVEWAIGKMQDAIVYAHKYPLGHMSFMMARDMSFFTDDVMSILNGYNGKEE